MARFMGCCLLFACSTAWCQDNPPQPAPTQWTYKGLDLNLLGDVYYTTNFNQPSTGLNDLYNFNVRADLPHLNMAKFSVEKASGMFGFRVDAGAGQAFTLISAADRAPDGMKYLEQAYLEFRPRHAHGLQIDAGKFVTSAGAEVLETNANWNYSRSLLFSWAIPYYHFGLRATVPVTKSLTAGVQLVNGWNNVKDNNSGKTIGLAASYAWKRVTWSNTYYTGPEKDGTHSGFRNLYDTVVQVNPSSKTGLYFNFDYGRDKNIAAGSATWVGFEAAARRQLTKRFAIAPRAGIFADRNGLMTGTAQTIKELTLTGEMRLYDGLLSRIEFRHDDSDHALFHTRAGDPAVTTQNTVTLGLIAFFGPKK